MAKLLIGLIIGLALLGAALVTVGVGKIIGAGAGMITLGMFAFGAAYRLQAGVMPRG